MTESNRHAAQFKLCWVADLVTDTYEHPNGMHVIRADGTAKPLLNYGTLCLNDTLLYQQNGAE